MQRLVDQGTLHGKHLTGRLVLFINSHSLRHPSWWNLFMQMKPKPSHICSFRKCFMRSLMSLVSGDW